MAVASGKNHSPRGSTNRVGTKAIFEKHPISRQAIDMGRMNSTIPISTDGLGGVIVRKEEEEVWGRLRF